MRRHFGGLRELGTDPSAAIPLLVEALERYRCVEVPADYPNSVRPALTTAYVLSGELDRAADVVEEACEQCKQAGRGATEITSALTDVEFVLAEIARA